MSWPDVRGAFLPARAVAPAKINLGLFVGPVREPDGRHELVSVMQSISLADTLTLEPAATAGGRNAFGNDTSGPGDGGPRAGDGPGEPDADVGSGVGSGEPRACDGSGEDEVLCPGLAGQAADNLAAVALRLFRAETGWNAPPLRLRIDKRIPVAAGLGGGSADAAAALRLARHMSGLGSDELLADLAARLGADVPAQIAPGRWLATGAGERLRELPFPSRPVGILVLPVAAELSSAAVYARLDELRIGGAVESMAWRLREGMVRRRDRGRGRAGQDRAEKKLGDGDVRDDVRDGGPDDECHPKFDGPRARARTRAAPPKEEHTNLLDPREDLHELERRLQATYASGAPVPADPGLLHNDLQAAATSLCSAIEPALAEARDAGADIAFVSGSGPTVVGLFLGADGPDQAALAAARLAGRAPVPVTAVPVGAQDARAHRHS